MTKKILIAGITGLIGKKLAYTLKDSYQIIGLVRNKESSIKSLPHFELFEFEDSKDILVRLIENTDVVINLSGRSIAKGRWKEKIKEEIYNSRIETTKKIADLILKASKKPELFIVASAFGYYGLEIDKISTEDSSPSTDFLGKVCVDWEKASSVVDDAGVRRVNVRIGTVLSRHGGALPLISLPFKFYLGNYFGSGNQYFPWIHEKDLIRLFIFIIENKNISGPINAVSPQSNTMKEFCKTLGKVLNKPCWIRVPAWKVNLILGEMGKLLTGGGKVIPEKALKEGFKFEFERLEDALRDLFNRHRS